MYQFNVSTYFPPQNQKLSLLFHWLVKLIIVQVLTSNTSFYFSVLVFSVVKLFCNSITWQRKRCFLSGEESQPQSIFSTVLRLCKAILEDSSCLRKICVVETLYQTLSLSLYFWLAFADIIHLTPSAFLENFLREKYVLQLPSRRLPVRVWPFEWNILIRLKLAASFLSAYFRFQTITAKRFLSNQIKFGI